MQGVDHRIFRATLPDGSESHVTFSTSGILRLKTGLTRAGLDARFFQWPPADDPDRPPYRGMRPLEAEDAGIFFGREAPNIEALDRLRGMNEAAPPRFLVILGASGAGKSSFLRAGLLPRLDRDDRNFLPLPIVRPERAALSGETGLVRSLEAALKSAGLKQSRAEVKKAVEGGVEAVSAFLAALGEKVSTSGGTNGVQAAAPRVVLAIDQGEELFLAEGAEEAKAFLALVAGLVSASTSNLIVVVTIRSDAYERLQTAPGLEGVLQETLSLPPLPKGAYQTVIEGPATRLVDTPRALKIEPALTAALLADVEQGGAKDALPLLAFTLERLYLEHGGDGDLRLSEYRELGGIKGSIDAAVEGALRAADADPAVPKDRAAREALLRRALIPWLAGIDPETGAPRRRVARLSEIPEEARPLVEHLIAARLLATDVSPVTGERTIEPAHEALLRQWWLLRGWLEEDLAALSALEAVQRAARDWDANARNDAWLAHTGGRLDDAEALTTRDDLAGFLNPTDRAYLAASRAADTARRDRELEEARKLAAERDKVARRTRVAALIVGIVAALAIGAAVFGFYQARRADEQAAFAIEQAAIAEEQRRAAEAARAEAEAERAAAELARADAEREKNRAEQNFAAAKQAVNSLIFDVAQGLQNVTGMRVETIRKILDTVRATVNRLAETAPDDPDLQKSQVWMYVFFADTYLAAGAVSDALDLADTGLVIARKLAAADTGNAEAQRDLSASLERIGNVRLQAGDRAGALTAFEESLAIRRKLSEADPGNAEAQRDLSLSLDNIGDVKLQVGDRAGALAAYEGGLTIRRKLAEADPGNTQAQRDVSVSLDRIGNVKLQAGDRVGALAALEESLAISRKLAEDDPDNGQAQRDLSVSLDRIGNVRLLAGDRVGALAAFEESLAIQRKLAKNDPGNGQAQRDLSVSLERIGDLKRQAGDRAGALAAYEESLAIFRRLAEADPGNALAQRSLLISLGKVGEGRLLVGQRVGALAAFEESLVIARRLAEADPGNAVAQRDLSASLEGIGDVRLQSGDRPGALVAYEESLAIRRKLTDANPGDAQAQRDLSVILNKIGDVKRQAGDRAGALATFEEGLAIARKLAEADPGNAEAQTDLVVSLTRVAMVSDDSRPLYAEALAILEALDAEGRLSMEQRAWIKWVKDQLATLPTDGGANAAEQ